MYGYPSRSIGQRVFPQPRSGGCSGSSVRIIIGLIFAGIALLSYFASSSFNPVTGETQHISLTQQQEIALGLQSAPEMAQEFGGEANDPQAQALVDRLGQRLVKQSVASTSGYPFEFTVLADDQTVNAFALPGGPVFITEALLQRLETEGQLAGVLGHEIGHVVARHSAEQLAQQELTQGLTGALVIATYDPNDPNSQGAANIAQIVGQFINLRYSRADELEADGLGVRLMSEAGYDPRSLIRVMDILEQASGGSPQPEFASTHPNPGNRRAVIQAEIQKLYPNGVPGGLTP